jgi:hypothetical protein
MSWLLLHESPLHAHVAVQEDKVAQVEASVPAAAPAALPLPQLVKPQLPPSPAAQLPGAAQGSDAVAADASAREAFVAAVSPDKIQACPRCSSSKVGSALVSASLLSLHLLVAACCCWHICPPGRVEDVVHCLIQPDSGDRKKESDGPRIEHPALLPVQALKRALDTSLAVQPTSSAREPVPNQAASADALAAAELAAEVAAEVAAEEEPDEDMQAAVLQLQQPWDDLVSAVQSGEEFKVCSSLSCVFKWLS